MATPTKLSYTIQDEDGVRANMIVFASYDGAVETVDGLIGEWLALGALVDNVTGGQIISGHVLIPLKADDTWKDAPIAGDKVYDSLGLVMKNEDTIYTDTITVPALRETLVTDGRPVLTEGGAIDLLSDAIEGSFTNGNFVNSGGADINLLWEAFRSTRSHRKQLTKASRVKAST